MWHLESFSKIHAKFHDTLGREKQRNYHAAPLQDSCSEVVCFGPLHSNRQRDDGQRCELPVFLMEGVRKGKFALRGE